MTLASSHSKSFPVSSEGLIRTYKPPGVCTGMGHRGHVKLSKDVFNMGCDKNIRGKKVPQSGPCKDRDYGV